jgi:hypothetical protein
MSITVNDKEPRLPVRALAFPQKPKPSVIVLLLFGERTSYLDLNDVNVLPIAVDEICVRTKIAGGKIVGVQSLFDSQIADALPKAVPKHPLVGIYQGPNNPFVKG